MSRKLSVIYGILLSVVALLYDVGFYFLDRKASQTYVAIPAQLYQTVVFAALVFLYTFLMLRFIRFSSCYCASLISAILCLILSSRIFMHWSLLSLCLIGMSIAFLVFGKKSRE